MIHPDDIMQAYIDADPQLKVIVSDLLESEVDSFVVSTHDSEHNVTMSSKSSAITSQVMTLMIMKRFVREYGHIWRQHLNKLLEE